MLCYQAPALGVLGEAYSITGDAGKASQVAEYGRDLAREKKQRGYEAQIAHVLGEMASRTEPFDAEKASAHYQTSLSAAVELGMRPLVAHCHLGLGKLYRRTDDGVRAQKHLTTAAALYRDMDMRFWLDKAEVALKEVG